MNSKNKGTIIAATIGAIATILAAIISSNYQQKKMQTILQNSIEKVTGDNNTININSVDDFIKDYQKVLTSNDRYAQQLEDTSKELEETKKQIVDTPLLNFKDLQLTIDGEEIPIDSTKSMVTIDGRDYLDKSFVDNLMGTDRQLVIKDNGAYIGKIIKDKMSLTDKWIVDSDGVDFTDSITDSYGNMCTNAMEFSGSESYAIFNLEEGYSLFKCRIALKDEVSSDITEKIVVKADDKAVYTSPALSKTKKPFIEADIPIKNCSLLTIECNADGYGHCIISDASVYN